MDVLAADFVNIFLLIFGLLLGLAGIFTVYFGAGKSRKMGAGLFVLGIVIVALTYWLYTGGYTSPDMAPSFWEYIKEPAVTIIAALVGAAVALLVFIGVITKA